MALEDPIVLVSADNLSTEMQEGEHAIVAEQHAEDVGVVAPTAGRPHSDFPVPRVLQGSIREFCWDENAPLMDNCQGLGRELAAAGDLYRAPGYADGLIFGSPNALITPALIREAGQLAPIIFDRVRVIHIKDGKTKGNTVPAKYLHSLLHSEVFLQMFPSVDEVSTTGRYLRTFLSPPPGGTMAVGGSVFSTSASQRIDETPNASTHS